MKTLSQFTFFLIALCFTAPGQNSEPDDCPVQIYYKSWFFAPPTGAVTGFQLKQKYASQDGYDRYCSYNRMRARGVLRFYEHNGRIKHRQDSLYFYYDPNSSSLAPTELTAADSFSVTKGHTIGLFFSTPEDVEEENQLLCSSSEWRRSMESEDRTYGYGLVSLSYYDHVGSWVSAESDALRDLLGKSAVLIASQQRNTESDIVEVVRYEYDLVVCGIKVERRWVDFEDWSCHVVVSAPKSEIMMWQPDSTDLLADKSLERADSLSLLAGDTSAIDILQQVESDSPAYKLYREEQKRELRRSIDSADFQKYRREHHESYRKFREDNPIQLR